MIVKNDGVGCITPAQMNLIINTRIFWRNFATWTRAYFRSSYLGLGSAYDVFERLYNLPLEVVSPLRFVFGNQFSSGYLNLLQQHVIILSELVSTQMEGDIEAINQNLERLNQNSNARARFLAEYNPFWNESDLMTLLNIYVNLTIDEANAYARHDFNSSIDIYDDIATFTNSMGDYFAHGLFNYIIYNPQNNLQNQGMGGFSNGENIVQCITYNEMELIYGLRMFWYELTTWVRAYFTSVYSEMGANTENVLARLYEVPKQYEAILTPFFGWEATGRYINLIYAYIDLLVALVNAQIAGDADAISQIIQQINQNLDERNEFLSSIDPYFNRTEWRNMIGNYTRYTIEEATAFMAQDHTKSLNIFDTLLRLSIDMGDFFAYELYLYITQPNENRNSSSLNKA